MKMNHFSGYWSSIRSNIEYPIMIAPAPTPFITAKLLTLDYCRDSNKENGVAILPAGETPSPAGRLAISTRSKIEMIELSEILYVKAESNYVWFYTYDLDPILLAKTLKQVCGRLLPSGFIRIHQSYLVHPQVIKKYHTVEGIVVLKDGTQLPVSRINRKKLSAVLMRWAL